MYIKYIFIYDESCNLKFHQNIMPFLKKNSDKFETLLKTEFLGNYINYILSEINFLNYNSDSKITLSNISFENKKIV